MNNNSAVETVALQNSGFRLQYPPTEKIASIIVDNFPQLGRLTALRFLEWTQKNPGGVIALPTGKTPEFFIKEVQRFLEDWHTKDVRQELAAAGFESEEKPDLGSLHFVQIDDFYPIDPGQHNSFYYYVKKFYIEGLGLDPDKALLIDSTRIGLPKGSSLTDVWPDHIVDLSLRYRTGKNPQEILQKAVLEEVDQWCYEYENKIRQQGGIGFFLGGIGPDGHIGFNIKGSDLNSTTRLTPTNYETQASAATDLGGIEISRNRLVITIGLSTITANPDCIAIIIAAGEAKAAIVADAIQHKAHNRYPATCLRKLPGARFYLTRGAARLMPERQHQIIVSAPELTDEQVERVVIDLSLNTKKTLDGLKASDFKENATATAVLDKTGMTVNEVTRLVKKRITGRIEAGVKLLSNKTFLHTEPHHDDIMLGYLPYIVRHIRDHSTRHHFATLTSGFTAVTNSFMRHQLVELQDFLNKESFIQLYAEGYFEPDNEIGRNRDVWQYLDGVAENSDESKSEGRLRRLFRNLKILYDISELDQLKSKINSLIDYIDARYPGMKDREDVQKLKGMCREWEADCLWGYFGWNSESVQHLRLGFYKGEVFTEEPTFERDVPPVLELLHRTSPDVISVALDPEASGPDTHYKVLQATTEALRLYERETGRSDLQILGYRNVWYRFHPAEANLYIPVSLNMFSLQDSAFKNAFITQKDASFPSYEYDGPFSELAQNVQVSQYQMLKICLGRQFFYEHSSALIRATRGMVFLKGMNLKDFYLRSRELRKSTENL